MYVNRRASRKNSTFYRQKFVKYVLSPATPSPRQLMGLYQLVICSSVPHSVVQPPPSPRGLTAMRSTMTKNNLHC